MMWSIHGVWILIVAILKFASCREIGATGGRIVGGTETTIQRHPYAAQLIAFYEEYNAWTLNCGGSVLSTRHVLSAAHCLTDRWADPRLVRVRAGSTSSISGGTLHEIAMILAHASYNNPPRDNDIAIVLLATPMTFGTFIQSVAIPAQAYELPDNSPVVHIGWGTTQVGGSTTVNLREVTVYSVNRTTCRARYAYLQSVTNYYYAVTDNMICAGILDVGGKDACQGDSGSPLLYGNMVVGITSWGEGCANATYPGVSARVSSYANWINNTLTQFPGAASTAALSHALLALSLLASLLFYAK